MQISANNLLIASQQARAAQPAKETFEPLPLRQTAPDAPVAQAQSPAPRPGSKLDIRV
jgi:hypothetical protein